MPKIVPVIEGDGEVTAVPALLGRLLNELSRHDVHVGHPKNAHGNGNLTKDGGIERFVALASAERDWSAVLVLLDAESECAKDLAHRLAQRVMTNGTKFPVVVCANRMNEAWLIASIETIAGQKLGDRPGLPSGLQPPHDVEEIGSAKGWLDRQFPRDRAYKETEDQEAMTRLLDFDMVRQRSRSFRRLCHAVEQALEGIADNSNIVTPISTASKEQQNASKVGTRRRGRKH